ncbi:hypothetical protein NE237_014739 [Protea cynaroides]|uniref:Uncharacterized protein n=1 Tax=Protea cynaroides TaxID=273540 RepID=A0A9Q0QQF0_9MAGN|nr:hypothetical protein NE237_014739 [Protea cynaroides]
MNLSYNNKTTCLGTNNSYDLVYIRMIQCFSDQVSELKMILCSSSNSSSTSGSIGRADRVDATTVSDFILPALAPTHATTSSFTSDALHQIVQDISAAETSGESVGSHVWKVVFKRKHY